MNDRPDEVSIRLDAHDFGPAAELGRLHRRVARGRHSVIAFSYRPDWLRASGRLLLDPSLNLYEGDQFASDGGLPGIFTDAAPDRWGRTLMERREAAAARRESRPARSMDEWDFLLGVGDEVRMGALRIADPADGRYLSWDRVVVPPLTRLRALQAYAQRADRGEELSPQEEDLEVALLIAPGSSLGGARPKASFKAANGELWLAKFPAANDRHDSGAWEYLLNQLAQRAEIRTPESELLQLAAGHRTFSARRFDRTPEGRRLYASSMTLAGKRDNESASYLDIVAAITRYGDPDFIAGDLEQLFRRLAFNVMVGNRDDHLRNHGFLGTPGGWRLSPAFDLNPVPAKAEQAIAIDGDQHAPDLELVRRSAPYYRLTAARADELLLAVRSAVQGWRALAAELSIARDEVQLMASLIEA